MVGGMVDDIFEHPRLVAVYDALDPDRSDLEVYVEIVHELGAESVLDIGCGTGTFALLLADRGLQVIGVDPAAGSLDVARAKPGAERVSSCGGNSAQDPSFGTAEGDCELQPRPSPASLGPEVLAVRPVGSPINAGGGARVGRGRHLSERLVLRGSPVGDPRS